VCRSSTQLKELNVFGHVCKILIKKAFWASKKSGEDVPNDLCVHKITKNFSDAVSLTKVEFAFVEITKVRNCLCNTCLRISLSIWKSFKENFSELFNCVFKTFDSARTGVCCHVKFDRCLKCF